MARRARSSRSRKAASREKGVERPAPKDAEPKKGIEAPKGQGEIRTSREVKERTTLKDWFMENRSTILILSGIFVLAVVLRYFMYYQIMFDTWPPNIVGNDPSYHKRVIDFVQTENYHLRIDHLLNYPLSGGNPRPPIFDWSIALMGIVISPLFGFHVQNATWWVYQFAPTFWGALTVFPVYLLGKETFNKRAGIMAALFLALTASHIERSTLGFTDHDSFVMFFVVLAFYFLSKAFHYQKDKNYVSDWRRSDSVVLGFRSFFQENKQAVGYAVLTGLAMATISLTWEGYAYVMAILLIFYLIQLLINRFRNEDSLGTFMLVYIAMGTVVLLSLPYYYSFSIATWSQGFYMLLAMTVLGMFIVPTRDVPWLIVLPTLALFLGASYLVLRWGFTDTADMLFTGGGYFVKSKLYSTIAEAQAPDVSRIVFIYGPATFLMALVGVVMAIVGLPKHLRKDYIVIVVWTCVAIFMSLSAIRFNFNATPAFALLAGWVLVELVRFLKAEGLSIVYSLVAVVVLFFGLAFVAEGWKNFFTDNYILITVGSIILGSLVYFGFMKYRRHRDYFQFRKIIAALFVGFVVIMPNLFFAVDAAIPIESKDEFDPGLKYLGSFGSSLHSEYWMDSYDWLAQQDLMVNGTETRPEERPAFMSWWDYGFDEVLLGKHPTAADNFQKGYQFTGSMISSQNESEAIALMTVRLLEGDWVNNRGKFSPEIWAALLDHVGSDPNSTMSAYELQRVFRSPGSYSERIEKNPDIYGKYIDVTPPNARYAAARVLLVQYGEDNLVALYHDIRGITGKSLRYFAVDYRLFPFSSSNTGIFYAPIKLADRDIDDFLEYKAYAQENTRGSNEKPEWTDYPDNPITMDKAKEEAERLGYKFRITKYDMFYTDRFYNSLFYKTYIGVTPSDLGATSDGKSIPGVMGDLSNIPPMQAWNMTHFKLVYRTMYYSEEEEANASFPDDYTPLSSKEALEKYRAEGGDLKSGLGQGVFYIKYFDGAIVEGRVRTGRGIGVPGVRVTVLDDYGIPHGNVITGKNGEYRLIAPPGETTFVVSMGDLANQYDKLYQFQVDQSSGQPTTPLNITQIEISDDLAMWLVDEGRIERDFIISGNTISGNVYWDVDDDKSYKEENDILVTRGKITFVHSGSSNVRYGPLDLGEDGAYSLEDLVPGKYNIEFALGNRTEVLVSDFNVDPKETGEKDIRLQKTSINGHAQFVGGLPANGSIIELTDEEGSVREIVTDANGNFSATEVFPGLYTLKYSDPRYYHAPLEFTVKQGDNLTFDIALSPIAYLDIRASMPTGTFGSLSTAGGAMVSIMDRMDVSKRWNVRVLQNGTLRVPLPAGLYDISAFAGEKDKYWAYLGFENLSWDERAYLDMALSEAFRVNGTLTRLVSTAFNGTEVQFKRKTDGAIGHAFSSVGGEYSIVLPVASYTVLVDNITSGNQTYYHMQTITPPVEGNELVLDIWAPKSISVSGRVYWDKDLNDRYTGLMESSGGKNEDGSPLSEDAGIEGIRVIFRYANGTIEAVTGAEGLYKVQLPPGSFEMEVATPGFRSFKRDLLVESTAEAENYGIGGIDAMMDVYQRHLYLNFSSAYYGVEGISYLPLAGVEAKLIATEPYRQNDETELTTGSDGSAILEVVPGTYLAELAFDVEINGMVHKYSLNQEFEVPYGQGEVRIDLNVEHLVDVKGQFFLVENGLIRYPPEMTVNFNAIKGVRVTVASAITDFNGNFETELVAGDFILEAHHDRPSTHYMFWSMVGISEGSSVGNYQLTQGFPVDGTVSPVFNGVEDSELFFESGAIWSSAGLDDKGRFSVFLFNGDYRLVYDFQTEESTSEGGAPVNYTHRSDLTIDGALFGHEVVLEKTIMVSGSVYYDANGDRTVDPEEKRTGVKVTFTPVDGGYEPVSVVSDPGGNYYVMVPFVKFRISAELEGFLTTPREDAEILDLPAGDAPFKDVPLVPGDVPIKGIIYGDSDDDGAYDSGEPLYSGMELTFTDEEDGSETVTTALLGGSFSLELPPGTYMVLGMKYVNDRPKYGYISELDVSLGQDLTAVQWKAVPAERFTGAVFYKDTNGTVHSMPPEDGEMDFRSSKLGTITVPYRDGVFTVDLPYDRYYISTSFDTQEYGMKMHYSLGKSLTVNETTQASDLSLEITKAKEYTFKINLVNDFQHEIEMNAGETVRLDYYVENTGNEPYTLDVSASEKPEGWSVGLPEGTDIELPIGGKVIRQLNITAPKEPLWNNQIKFEGASDKNTKSTFAITLKTPPSYRFDVSFDAPSTLGIGYGERKVFNVTIENQGSGEDVVLLKLSPDITTLTGWSVEWEGEQEFPASGLNVSLTPKGVRKFALTVVAPAGGNESTYNDRLTLSFTGRNRIGDTLRDEITIETRKANLVLPPGYLKLTNRKLSDAVLNNTIEANITIRSLHRDAYDVKVVLKVDNEVVAEGMIPYVPQDGVASTKLQFDVAVKNISRDDFHTFEVFVDPDSEVRETDDFDNAGIWYNVVIGKAPEDQVDLNWRIVAFVVIVILVSIGVIAYRQKTMPI